MVSGKTDHQAGPGSATKATIKIVGRPARGDLNGDGKADAAVFLMMDPDGSGGSLLRGVAHCAATTDRAEIGHIRRLHFMWIDSAPLSHRRSIIASAV